MNNLLQIIESLPSEKRAILAEILLRSLPHHPHAENNEPIAIIGMACRFPGGAVTPEAYWHLLREGIDAISDVPADRWNKQGLRDMLAQKHLFSPHGGFINDIDQFDAAFFGISPREANAMDPQQRLLLEVVWEALEDAGQRAEDIDGSQTGVFIGIGINDYGQIRTDELSLDEHILDTYSATGNAFTIAANRISYYFNFHGPSMAIDTACSSSLVSIHLACQSLWNGESTLALAGGSNLILAPETSVRLRNFLSPDGRCRTFDASANGYVRGEGVGIVVLKPMAQAIADGDDIYAVVKGSAVNQDGRSSGLTVPNGPAQQQVLRAALQRAHVQPAQVQYIEAHGTGTALGDPIEANVLGTVLAEGRAHENKCAVGSVKTNIGHLEAAAGIAGFIKVALMLKNQQVPPSLHFKTPNPAIPFAQLPLHVPQALHAWPPEKQPAIAGVSAFGFGGTNAHIVLAAHTIAHQPHQSTSDVANMVQSSSPNLLLLSAKNPQALRDLSEKYVHFLRTTDAHLDDICFSSRLHRQPLPYRLAVAGYTIDEMQERLTMFLAGRMQPQIQAGEAVSPLTDAQRPVFVFSGQGSQWIGMGRKLLHEESPFRAMVERCDALLHQYTHWSIVEALCSDAAAAHFEHTEQVQPILFALQVGLATLWRSWGIEPVAAIGHSVGEIAAAYVAGILSLEDGIKIAYYRGQSMQATHGQGKMLVVGLSQDNVKQFLQEHPEFEDVSIAAINSPTSTVLAGDAHTIAQILQIFQHQHVFARINSEHYAFHHPRMEHCRIDLLQAIPVVDAKAAVIPFFSTVEGTQLEGQELTMSYWGRNVRETVRFSDAINALLCDGYQTFLEIDPQPVLSRSIHECLAHKEMQGTVIASLRRGQNDNLSLLTSAGQLYTQGHRLHWRNIALLKGRYVRLPFYPWQHQRYWIEPTPQKNPPASTHSDTLMHQVQDWFYDLTWQETPLPARTPEATLALSGCWLIFSDRTGVGETMAQQLQAQGAVPLLISSHPLQINTTEIASRHISSLTDKHALDDLLAHIFVTNATPVRGIIYLCNLDATRSDQTTATTLLHAQEAGCAGLLNLLQALLRARQTSSRIWVLTRGALPLPAQPSTWSQLNIAQAPVWGMGRVIALEHPELWGGLIDVDSTATHQEISDIVTQEVHLSDEDQVGWHAGKRFVARLVADHTQYTHSALPVRPDGAYLITGGLGGLGLQLARRLAQQGARTLYLLSRRALPSRAIWHTISATTDLGRLIATLQSLEQDGTSVFPLQADLTDQASLHTALNTLQQSGTPLRGIIHAAGLSTREPLDSLTWEHFVAIMRPKVEGMWNVYNHVQIQDLDFCILFSSAAAVWGLKDSAHYAAANHCLDMLAYYLKARGLPILSINWGPWQAEGMATREVQQWFHKTGVEPLPPEAAFQALIAAWSTGSPQKIIAQVNWSTFKPIYEAKRKRPLLDRIAVPSSAETEISSEYDKFMQRLLSSHPQQRRLVVEELVQTVVSDILGLPSSATLSVQQRFAEIGMDSLMSVEVQRRLQAILHCELPSTLAFNYPTVDAITTYLIPLLATRATPQSEQPLAERTPSGDAPPTDIVDIEQLSDAEAEALLMRQLESLSSQERKDDGSSL